MSSTTPPSSLQSNVYCAWPGPILPRSAVRQRLTKSAAPAPATVALPRWLTSKMPTALRTAACSANTPAPTYSKGIDQPLNAANLALAATCRSCSGDFSNSPASPFSATLSAILLQVPLVRLESDQDVGLTCSSLI